MSFFFSDLDALLSSESGDPWSDMMFADWNFCDLTTEESKSNRVDTIINYIKLGKRESVEFERCKFTSDVTRVPLVFVFLLLIGCFLDQSGDRELFESLLYDIETTREAQKYWKKRIEKTSTYSDDNARE